MKKKILLVHPTGGYCGVDVCFLQILQGLDREKFEPIVILPPGAYIEDKIKKIKIKVYNYDLIWWFPIYFEVNILPKLLYGLKDRIDFISSVIIEENIDLVYTNTTVFMDSAIAAFLNNRTHIWHVHAAFVDDTYRKMEKEMKETVYKIIGILSDKVVTPSLLLKQFLSEYIDDYKIEVIFNGVDPKIFFPSASIENRQKKFLTSIGDLNDNKNQIIIVEALERVIKKYNNVRLRLVGTQDAEYVKLLEDVINIKKLDTYVNIDTFREDIPDLLRETDIFISSSKTETFPISIVEAQASGVPVISTKTNGAMEIIRDGQTGFLVNSSFDMSNKIVELLLNHDRYFKMRSESYNNFIRNYSLGMFTEKFSILFNSIKINKMIKNRSLEGISDKSLFFGSELSEIISRIEPQTVN